MMEEPRFIQEGWAYVEDDSPGWKLKPDAPNWAKKEFEEFRKSAYPEEDDNGVVTRY